MAKETFTIPYPSTTYPNPNKSHKNYGIKELMGLQRYGELSINN